MQFFCKDSHFFINVSGPYMLKRLFLINILLLLSLLTFAAPARPGRIYLAQPDGSGFYAFIYGDEFMKVKVTSQGNAIIQEEDGWWYYALYDSTGQKVSTGCRVGETVSSEVLLNSQFIPYENIAQSASRRRALVESAEIRERGILSRIRRKVCTRAGGDVTVEKRGLILLVQFKGETERFTYTKEDFINMLTQQGYNSFGAQGSAKDYFDDQFKGMYDFHFDVSDIVTLDKERAYYGKNNQDGNDENPHMMVIDACQLLDASIDFAKYDQDGDGDVDNVFVFFAGKDEAEGGPDDTIWSHAWYIKDGAGKNLILDGVRINRYACASELISLNDNKTRMAAIGTFCHEYSHALGLSDLYDTDYQVGGFSAGTWKRLSLMDGGNYNNNGNTPPNFTAIEREMLQTGNCVELESAGEYSLLPVSEGSYCKIDSDNEGEYFLLECRTARGWDQYIGGEGLLVYHIDRSSNDAGFSEYFQRNVTAIERWDSSNEVNALASHQCADLLEADGRPDAFNNLYDSSYQNYLQSLSGLFFPYAGQSITPTTTPGFKCWGDAKVNSAISDISYRDGKVTFTFSSFYTGVFPTPVELRVEPFQNGAIVSFLSDYDFDGDAKVICDCSGETVSSQIVKPYEAGKWSCRIEGLDYSTSYSVTVYFVEGDTIGEKSEVSFMTKREQKAGYPYIYLVNVDRTEDGKFYIGSKLPLQLFNVHDAQEISWTFNGKRIELGPDCYYTITESGVLKAHIVWKDGTEETIIKEINTEEHNEE